MSPYKSNLYIALFVTSPEMPHAYVRMYKAELSVRPAKD